MPGFAEFGTQVDVQISAIINPLLEIIGMRPESQKVSNAAAS